MYSYSIKSGVTRSNGNIKKIIASGMASLVMAVGMTVPAFAAGNSTSGLNRYLANPGRLQATEIGAQCGSGAGSGAFGYLGQNNNMAGGADGTQTGINNSAICGNN